MPSLWEEWKSKSLGQVIASRVMAWWGKPDEPDPWPVELDVAIQSPMALAVCHRCISPQAHSGWFCPECGTAVGPYNNIMPFVYIYSIGEVARSGVGPEARFTPLTTTGYVLFGLTQYQLFSPWYFVRLYLNYRKLKLAQ
jgi:hypothetical protein